MLVGERLAVDEDHAMAGGRILEAWGLPQEIVEVVAHHHLGRSDNLHNGLRQGRAIADALGYRDGLERAFEVPRPRPIDPVAASALH